MKLQMITRGLPTLFLALSLCSIKAAAQSNPLKKYIEEALNNNRELKQQANTVEKAGYGLKVAESFYLPSVSFQAAYQTGAGGRNISMPVGDLLNPVYSSLNQLTRTNQFPAIKNVDQDFLIKNFYDAKVRTTVPIINTDLAYNKKIEQHKIKLEGLEADIFKPELVKNVKVAYYTYVISLKAIQIYTNALALADETVRVNERLLQNGKGIPTYVLRAKTEQQNYQSKIIEAQKASENASLYFNFLLNRQSGDSIEVVFEAEQFLSEVLALITSTNDVSSRAELSALKENIEVRKTVTKMQESFWMPKLNGIFDIGTQAQDFKLNKQARYYNAALQLEIPLFSGKRNQMKVQVSKLEEKNAALQYEQTSKQLELSANTFRNNLLSVYQSYLSSVRRIESATSYHKLIDRGFKEGVNTFLEHVDARSLLTGAKLEANMNLLNLMIAAANLSRQMGSLN